MLRQESRVKLRRDSNVSSNRQVITIAYIKIVLYPIKLNLYLFFYREKTIWMKRGVLEIIREKVFGKN